ncbi:MAG: hypothetical protein HY717_05195 [Planctomycetes bacterium]|nr:hypothetical protein [Planctomycetota bacterium]
MKSLKTVALLFLALIFQGRAPAQEVYVDLGSAWKFFRGKTAPSAPDATAWRTVGFDDASWESGPTGIGYSDQDDATVLTDMMGQYRTVYARKTFNVANPATITSLLLTINYDDGFICYINGTEVARAAMGNPGVEFTFDQDAPASHEGVNVEYIDITASAAVLTAGQNLMAVEVHNNTLGSSDLSFNPRLSANDVRVSCPTGIACAKSPADLTVTLTWTNNGVYDAVSVTRNGLHINGSPFPGDNTINSAVDDEPGNFNSTYQVTAKIGAVSCDPLSCTVNPIFTLIQNNETWKFFRPINNTAPSDPLTEWRKNGFVDDTWESGPTGIGYGDGDDATDLSTLTPPMQNNYWAVYCRKAFTLGSTGIIHSLSLGVNYDDGFIAFLNGAEVARSTNMGAAGTEFTPDQPATVQHDATGVVNFDLTPFIPNLVSGTNVLGVEVHNNTIGSTDLSFIPTLTANGCLTGLDCTYEPLTGHVALTWNPVSADSIAITRNGTPLAGSPFAGDATSAVDANPLNVDNRYEVVSTVGGFQCAASVCTITCGASDPDALTCQLSLVGGSTQAQLSWSTPPGTTAIDVRREGALQTTLPASATSYTDPNVESVEPENDTDFTVTFHLGPTTTCTIACGPDISLCPENFICTVVKEGGKQRAKLTWDNLVKEWTGFTIQRDGADLATGLSPATTSYTDTSIELVPGTPHTYTLVPVAPAGEEVGTACNRSCTTSAIIEELANYKDPAGGWDYRLDFENPNDDKYNAAADLPGNLDGNWIRPGGFDFWDGSAPDVFGPAPGGPAPGGAVQETVAGGGPCGVNTGVLHLLDPGDPSNPGGTYAAQFPLKYNEPNNRRLFLGYSTGVADRNLLRDGVTFAARWRAHPNPPAYMNPQATGDGSPIDGGLGQVGIYFVNDGSLTEAGATAALSFSLESGDLMDLSSNTNNQLQGAHINTFRNLWVTVEDPEKDNTYNINLYINGQTAPFTFFGTAQNVTLTSGNLIPGIPAGNYLGLGVPSIGNDADIQIDSIAYKNGVHAPAAEFCGGGPSFRRGDLDNSGAVDISDPINELHSLFLGDFEITCQDAADFDDSGEVDITDAINSLLWQFGGGAISPAPGPFNCGLDFTPDTTAPDIGCTSYTAACP